MRHVAGAVLGIFALVPRDAEACPMAEPNGTTRYLTRNYAVGASHSVGGALGPGVTTDAIRYSETNGALMDLLFGAPIRLVVPDVKRIDCSAGACTYFDVTLWTPSYRRLVGGMWSAGVSFPFDYGNPAGNAFLQLGIAIGFYDDGLNKHARDAIAIGAAVPITRRVHARMRAELNLYGLMGDYALPAWRKNSPMFAGLTADLGRSFQVSAELEKYDLVRAGVGWSTSAAIRF
jgi:hypothetical protein